MHVHVKLAVGFTKVKLTDVKFRDFILMNNVHSHNVQGLFLKENYIK